jgi:hypothetical protein
LISLAQLESQLLLLLPVSALTKPACSTNTESQPAGAEIEQVQKNNQNRPFKSIDRQLLQISAKFRIFCEVLPSFCIEKWFVEVQEDEDVEVT